MSEIDMSLVCEYVRFYTHIKRTEDCLKKEKLSLKQMGNELLDLFAETGVKTVKLDNGVTLSVKRQIWASASGDDDAMHEALRAEGQGDLIEETVNKQTLSSLIREYPIDEATGMPDLPKELAETIKVTEVYTMSVRGT